MNDLLNVFGYNTIYMIGLVLTILYGLCFGSFLNVLIYRLPLNESIVKRESHCVNCGESIRWYDNIPVISYVFLGGKCRNCKSKISIKYPLVELLNTILWVIVYCYFGIAKETLFYMLFVSVLIAISIIDERTFEIPLGLNICIFVLGIGYTILDFKNLASHIIGMFCISILLFLIWFFTNGMGFGDVRLMFVSGLLLGWKIIIPSFLIGCIIAIIVHSIRMKVSHKEHKLAFGPYLCIGMFIGLFVAEPIFNSYLRLIGAL